MANWDGPIRIVRISVKPCSKNLRVGIRSLEQSANCAPQPCAPQPCAPQPSRSSRWFGRSARSKKTVPSTTKKKVGAGWRQGFCWYERAGERPERTQAVGLKDWWAGLQLAERASDFTAAGSTHAVVRCKSNQLQPPGDERACPMSSIRNLRWPSQWRFQIPAGSFLRFELASQSVVI
jgi:hypothetical protein